MKTNDCNLIHPVDFLDNLTDKIDNFFNKEVINRNWNELIPFKSNNPSVNIAQTDSGAFLEMAVPGCDKKDITISLEKSMLTISCKKEENKQTFTKKEFSYHSFSRSFNISDSLDKDNIKSSMNNGILTIDIPKLSPEIIKAQKKTIPVQ